MSKKFNILLVLAALLCLALSASAVTSPYVVVKQNAQTIKTRGEIKDHFKRRSITTFRGNSVTNQNNIASTAFSPNKAPAATAVKIPDLIGSVVQSNAGLNVGIYSINENGLKAIKTDDTMNAGNGGAALDGKYICCLMDQFGGQVYGAYYRVFDMSDWTLIEDNHNADFNLMSECMTSDGSVIYGCFYNIDLSGYELGTMSLTPVKRTGTIRSLAEPYSALACDAEALYGIYGDGRLVKINKSTGEETMLTNIGIVSHYLTSAAYDSKTGILYYASCTDAETALYSIDFNNGYAVSKICDLQGEVCGMHIVAPLAEDGAPAAVSDLTVSFGKGALSGNATFTMPSKTFAGNELTGNLSYKVMANDGEIAQGNAAPGTPINAPIQVTKADMYKFTVIVSNSIGDSPSSNKVNLWVGPDKPYAPENVVIAYENGTFNISWDAVTASENNGYFDASEVTYTVARYNNGVKETVVADGITATQCEDAVAQPEQLSIYTYKVTATFEGTVSNEAKSNAVVMGNIIPPYTNELATSDDFCPFTVIDSNDDNNNTWGWQESGCAFIGFNWQNDMDDWLMSAPVKLEAGKAYRLAFDARGESEYYKDHFEVKMGDQCNVSAMTTELIGVTELTDATYRTYYALITPETTGIYYIGIHGLSKKNMGSIYIDNFTIEAPIPDSAPAIVENVKFTAQPDGSAAIDVSFNAPDKNIAGNELASIADVKVNRDGNLVHTFTNVSPGAPLTFKDVVGEETTVHYTIVASNEFGEGIPYDKDAYAGLKLPATPTDCKIVESATVPGQVTVTWNPLAQDVDGDSINSDLITYTMVDMNTQIVATGLTAEDAKKGWTTTIDLPENGEQALAIFYIFAENRVGRNPINGFTQMIPVGNAYTVPFKESCPEALLQHVWMNEGAYWSTAQSCYQPVCMPQDDDQGMFYLEPFLAKENNLLLSGKILIPESDKVGLSFYYCGTTDDLFDLAPTVRIPSGETYYLTEPIHTNSVGTGWQRVFVSLAQFKGKVVQVGVNVNARSQQDYFLLDNIEVREFLGHDVAVAGLTTPATMTVGVDNKVTATITNMGTHDADNIAVQLLSDNDVVETVNIEHLAVSAKQTVEITVRPTVTQTEATTYKVNVVYDSDEDLSNNESEAKTVEFIASELPVVTINGAVEGNQVTLAWDSPDTESKTIPVTDDLEAYESFAIGKAENYTFYDIDGDETFGLSDVMFENQSKPMSYIVFDIEGIDEESQNKVANFAHSGSKCFAAFSSTTKANDDWLISPELPGMEQTISFWNRSTNVNYGYDQFEVLYSTTGNTPADFVKLGDTYSANLGWSKVEVQLPEGSKYFAIRCISYQTEAWLIDDISYTRGTPSYTVIGYNIYRDCIKINDAVVTDNKYVDNLTSSTSETDNHSYNVTAVYAEGESGLSNTYETAPSGIDDTHTDGISIKTSKGVIIVEGASNVAVYGIDGKIHGIGHENTIITVEPGFYVVKADGKVATVSVR